MKTKLLFITLTSLLAWGPAASLWAVEGAMGRPISGAAVMPFGGIVPPAPGFSFVPGELYYMGDIGGSGTTPTGTNLALDLEVQTSFTMLTGVYIWNTPGSSWNFASSLTLPVTWLEAEANVTLGPRLGHVSDHDFGLFDILITPLLASHAFNPDSHLALGLSVWAPTGSYDPNRLANLSTNTWTFVPTLVYTRLWRDSGVEFTSSWELTFDTRNTATDYQNGVLSDFEFLVIKRFPHGPGFGVIGSWIEQLNDDSGPTADALHGFSGSVLGVGVVLAWPLPLGKETLEFDLRWVHEFEAKNRIEGDLIGLTMTAQF